MAFRRWRRRALIFCGLATLPLWLWLLVVLIAPTGWARRLIVAQLESRSGRRVGLEHLSVGLFGGVRLTNLEIGSPHGTSDPWLKAADIRVDFGICEMLGGHCRPRQVAVTGAEVRVLRRADGTIELADLIRPVEPPRLRAGSSDPGDRVNVRVEDSAVTVVDEPTRTRFRLEDVSGEGYSEGTMVVVDEVRGTLNDGEFRFAARVDRTVANLSAEGQLHLDDVAFDEGMNALRYAVPVLADASSIVNGRVNADLYLHGRGATWPALNRDLSGRGSVALERISLENTPMVAELSKVVDLGRRRRIGSIRTEFTYKDRKVSTDRMTVGAGRIPIALSGWTDLDGNLEYRVKLNGLDERLPAQARRILSELKVEVRPTTALTLRGTLSKPTLEVNQAAVDAGVLRGVRLRPDEREKLRLLGRQLRDQFLR